jgi:putative hydrolase of the HAD superfamily
LVTDGNKIVQRNKINAMNLDSFFKKIFITYQYGIKYSKPSLYCFKKIIEAEKAEWKNLVYIGDNPYKDFVNLNRMGAQTIRIRRGPYKNTITSKGCDAKIQISNLEELRKILRDSFDEK